MSSLIEQQKWLYSLAGLGWQMELGTPRALMKSLGEPMAGIPAIHVAGTNGKGSMTEMCSEILRAAGLRVGTYTSPHLLRITERVRINGSEIGPASFASCLGEVRRNCRRLRTPRHPSFFECVTAAAFLAFRELKVDVAVIETGLGGRLDATRFLPWTLAQAFGPTGLEHTDRLGKTLAKIAGEKAALMRAGVPAVVAPQPRGAAKVFSDHARVSGSREFRGGRDFWVRNIRVDEGGTRFNASFSRGAGLPPSMDLETPMAGEHQAWNGACAVLASSMALTSLGLGPQPGALRTGLARAKVQGRFQILPGKPRLILDTACNPAALESVVRTFQEVFPGKDPVILAGFLLDKDVNESARILSRLGRGVVTVRPPVPDRARPAAETAAAFRRRGTEAFAVEDPARGLALARGLAGPRGTVLVTGSLFLVGSVLKLEAMRRIG